MPKGEGAASDQELPYTMGDASVAVDKALAMTLTDVMSRRLRATFHDEPATLKAAPGVAKRAAAELGLDEQWIADQLPNLEELASS